MKQILMPQLMQRLFDKRINEQPQGEGIAGIPWWLRKRMG